MTTKAQIEKWFDEGVVKGAAYMLIVLDTFDMMDSPMYARTDKECIDEWNKLTGHRMFSLMEIYDLRMDKAAQMAERRAMHYPERAYKEAQQAVMKRLTDGA